VNSTIAGSSADNVTSNTVAYWPFDEGAELADATGNGHLLVNTAVTFSGNAAVFDAYQSSKLVTQSNLAFSTYSNLTVECFFCMTTNYPATTYGFLITSAATYGNAGTINLYQTTTDLTADFFTTSGVFDQANNQGLYTISTGVWHHAAMVIDSSRSGRDPDRLRFYVDQVRMKNVVSNTLDAALADKLLYIGTRGTEPNNFFTGKMDDIRVTAAALTPNEFIRTRTRTANTNCIAYWPFNTGNELADASGNGHALSNSQVAFTNGSALFSSVRSSGLATLSPLPFEESDDVTVEFFVCTTATPSSCSFMLMSGETYGMQGSLSCYSEPGRNNLVTDLYDSGARYDSEDMRDNPLNDGKWHHVAILVDSSKADHDPDRLRLYVDRVRQTVRNVNCLDSTLFNRILYIGQRGTEGSDHFDGRLDDIRITGRLLSTNEFLAATDRTASYGCVAYWTFKEGREMEDASGNGYALVNSNVTFYAGSAVFDKALPSQLVTSSEIPFNDLVDVTVECFVRTTYVPPNFYSFLTHAGPTYGQTGTFACYVTYQNTLLADITQTPNSLYNQAAGSMGGLTDGAWHHVAYVMERSAFPADTNNWFRLYVDGVRQPNVAAKCTQSVLYNNRFYIGARGAQGVDYYSGRLDDVKITGAALPPSAFMTRRTFYEGTTLTIR
jgi:hypothetical protein